VQVSILDANGDVVPITGTVLRLGLFREGQPQPSNNRLDGVRERATVNGVAVFSDLRVNDDDDNYRLRVLADALPEIAPLFSDFFDVD
jgi:hypothetical protein